MTPTLPRPIEPGEKLRKGQRVCARCREADSAGITRLAEFDVDHEFDGQVIASGDGRHVPFYRDTYDWLLLAEAPTPAPKPWREQLADELRAWADAESRSARYSGEYATGSVDSARRIANAIEKHTIGASIPDIPDHGDGCSPWLWDKETGTAWVAAIRVRNYAPAYVQTAGDPIHGGFLRTNIASDADIARRLVPWSERGQAK